jgi:predicted transcriptional regulator
MSARAAVRLETLGFQNVYRYTPGEVDWFAFGLPMEGERKKQPQAIDVVRRDVPACRLEDRVGEVHSQTEAAGWKVCVVVDKNRVVLGRLRREAWEADPEAPAEQIMENGPTTFRPDHLLEPLVQRMQKRKVGSVIVSDSDGVLIGVLYRQDAEDYLKKQAQAPQAVDAR